MIVKGYRLGPLLKKTGREVLDDNVLGLAAELAYYFFFSLFPIFLFMAPLLALIGDKRETFSFVMNQLARAVPAEGFALVKKVVEDVVFTPNAPGLVSVGALLAIWSGSSVFMNIMGALNTAYDCDKDGRPWWKRQLIAIGALFAIGLIFAIASIVMVAGGNIVDKIGDALHIGATARVLWSLLQYAIALSLLVCAAWAIYTYLPDVRQNRWHSLAGAVTATVLWIVVTLGFRTYVQNFGNYSATYGTIGAVIVVLTWMYLSMIVLLTGGELAAELHHGTGALRTRVGHLYNGWISDGGEVARSSVEQVQRVTPAVPTRTVPRDVPPRSIAAT